MSAFDVNIFVDNEQLGPASDPQSLAGLGSGVDLGRGQGQQAFDNLTLSPNNGFPLSPQEVESLSNPNPNHSLYDISMKRSEATRDDAHSHDRGKRRRTGAHSSITSPALSRSAHSSFGSSPSFPPQHDAGSHTSFPHQYVGQTTSYPDARSATSQHQVRRQSHIASSQQDDALLSDPQHQSKPPKKDRSHRCPHCGTAEKVFTTKNDLDRHRKTFHGLLEKGEKVYQCRIPGCGSAGKMWPRFDNFKQHVTRMHGANHESDIEDMAVYYDEAIHGRFESSKGRNKSKSNQTSFSTKIDQELNDVSNVDSGPHYYLNNSTTGIASTSVNQAFNAGRFSRHSMVASSFPSPSGWQGYPANTGLGVPLHQYDRRTVADPEMLRHQRDEIQRQNKESFTYEPTGASNVDLGFVGEAPDVGTTNSADPFSSSSMRFAPSLYAPGSIDLDSVQPPSDHRLTTILEQIDGLSDEQRQKIRNQLGLAEREKPQASTRSAKSSKQSPDVKADGEKAPKTLKCGRENCQKMFSKCSDLHKHERRHEKKYGCTFDSCFKRFGTKWEWKRHESTQHIQLKEWRCQHKTINKESCATHFEDEQKMLDHLTGSHNMTELDAQEKLKIGPGNYCLAKRWLGSFWCGFCDAIQLSHAAHGMDMENERYNHIAGHLDENKSDRPKREMDHWIELRKGGRVKEELYEAYQKEKNKGKGEDDHVQKQSHLVASPSLGNANGRGRSRSTDMQVTRASLSVNTNMQFARHDPANSPGNTRGRQSVASPVPDIRVTPADEDQDVFEFDNHQPLRTPAHDMQGHGLPEMPQTENMSNFYLERTCCQCPTRMYSSNSMQVVCSGCGHDFCQDCGFEDDGQQQWPLQNF